jgi:hypothetical protein
MGVLTDVKKASTLAGSPFDWWEMCVIFGHCRKIKVPGFTN